jgi:hypothetical protein
MNGSIDEVSEEEIFDRPYKRKILKQLSNPLQKKRREVVEEVSGICVKKVDVVVKKKFAALVF